LSRGQSAGDVVRQVGLEREPSAIERYRRYRFELLRGDTRRDQCKLPWLQKYGFAPVEGRLFNVPGLQFCLSQMGIQGTTRRQAHSSIQQVEGAFHLALLEEQPTVSVEVITE
jgi:hypothetical protein